MTNKEQLISRIDLLWEQEIISLLNAVTLLTKKNMLGIKPDCPYCGSRAVIRYGHKCGKQRFFGRVDFPLRRKPLYRTRRMAFPHRTPYKANTSTVIHRY